MNLKSIFMAAMLSMALLAGLPAMASDQLNINQASVSELQSVKGIGKKTAEAIIAYRDQYGPFKSVSDLVRVKGIGAKSLERIQEHLMVEPKKETSK